MNNLTFGNLLEKLLYISNQKKVVLAKELGYDVSYINKWILSKNMPSSKRINEICKNISTFIINSLDDSTLEHLIEYFEINPSRDLEYISNFIETRLRDTYMDTVEVKSKSSQSIPKNTHSEEYYNTLSYVKPTLYQRDLLRAIYSYSSRNEALELIITLNLFTVDYNSKIAIGDMKRVFYELSQDTDIKVKFLLGLEGENTDLILNALLGINLICTYPSLDFDVYNCNINANTSIFAMKDKFFFTNIHLDNGESLLSTMSKESKLVDEFYYNVNYASRSKGRLICDKSSPSDMILEQTYIQYIMNNDLRCLLGSINEFFMPEELFLEVAQRVFGHNELIMHELRKINVFLQNVTYKSKLKVLIYESELRKYMSSGEMHFFNTPVTLTYQEREQHIAYIEKILMESDHVEIRLVDGDFVDDFKNIENPSLYLSKNLKFTKVHPEYGTNDYCILADNDFKNLCHDLFDKLWNDREDIVLDNKEDILERISKSITYTRLISESFGEQK